MTDKELKKLSRAELLELLLEQTKKVELLSAELELKNKELENKRIIVENAGNLAEATLKLNNIFETAQKAADQYLYNVRAMVDND